MKKSVFAGKMQDTGSQSEAVRYSRHLKNLYFIHTIRSMLQNPPKNDKSFNVGSISL